MHCAAFESRLQHLLDERCRPEDDDALIDHAAGCAGCREVLEVQAGVFDTVRDWSVSGLDVDLVERVLDCVAVRQAEEAAASRVATKASVGVFSAGTRRWLVRTLIAVAAGLMLTATVWQWQIQRSNLERTTPNAANDVVESNRKSDAQKIALIERRGSSAHVSELARGLGHGVARGIVYVQRGHFDSELQLPEPVAASLRPIKDSMAAAIDAVRRTLSLRNEQPVIRSSWRMAETDVVV